MEAILQEKQSIEQTDVQRPFQGLRSYEEKNKTQFGGRDIEISELFNLVEANRLTIVFGKSGIGKTSLLKAGLIPELQRNYFFPVYIRIDHSSDKTPLDQVRELVYEKLKATDTTIPTIGEQTLWEYFTNLRFLDGLLTPVLIFDQFEEIFTIGKEKNNAQKFIVELSDLAENRVPMVVQEQLQNKFEVNVPVYGQQRFHVIISLREDYLAQLESFKRYIPSMKDSRFRIVQMTALQAMDAVMKPAKKLIEKDVAEEIIRKLPGITELDFQTSASDLENENRFVVEPFLLSLICYEINEKRIEKGLDKITRELVSQFDISDVINLYYAKTIQGFGDNVQQGIEDTLLTEAGFRKLQSLEELQAEYQITSKEIQELIDKRIIRKELRDGVEYVELIHDVLTPVIKARRYKRLVELKEKEKNEAVRRAVELDRNKRNKIARNIILLMMPVLAFFLWRTAVENKKNKNKYENLAFARKLLLTANIVSNVSANDTTAARISRIAYLINKENNGGNEIEFYNSMYKYLNSLSGGKLEVGNVGTTIRDIVNNGDDVFYFACTSGEIYRKNGIDSSAQLFYNIESRVTSLAISPDKKYLAASGFSDSIKIFNLQSEYDAPINLPTGNTTGNAKSVCFTEDNKLILRLDSAIIGWQTGSWKKISWNQKVQTEIDNKITKSSKSRIPSNADEKFKLESDALKFSCFTSSRDKIAIGSDSLVIIIKPDSIFKIRSIDIGSPTSIEFDPSGNYLFIGNTLGTVCRMSLIDFSTDLNQFQTARVTDIAFSKNGNYMATSSYDRTVGIWDLSKNWNSLTPLLFPSQDVQTNIYCIAFSSNSEYVLSGYWNGKIFKWPVRPDILESLICSNVNSRLDTAVIKKIMKKDFDLKKFGKDSCNKK